MRKDLTPASFAKLLPRDIRKASVKYGKNGEVISEHKYECLCDTPVAWFDVPFANPKQCAIGLDLPVATIIREWKKYACLDHLPPGKNSEYYFKTAQEDEFHFIPRVIDEFGVKAVARAYRIEYSNLRKKRAKGKLWTLAWWPRITALACNPRLETEKELVERISMPPRRPYVYVVCWTKQNKKYIGSRTADYCTPDDLMKSYFSSSPNVMEFIYSHGLPDKHLIHECDGVMKTLHTESFLLKMVSNSPANIQEQYLNKMYHMRNFPYSALPPYVARNVSNHNTRKKRGLIEA